MSALDQAFIKAYAKDTPAAAAAGSAAGTEAPRSAVAPIVKSGVGGRPATADSAVQSQIIEQIYHDGTLYRVEMPPAAAPRRIAVPAPHFQLPPRSSPRRTVRRSVLKLLGGGQELTTPMPVEPPAKPAGPARKRPQSANNSLTAQTIRRLMPAARRAASPAPQQDLPPEVIVDAPQHGEPSPVKAAPAYEPKLPPLAPAAPVAPLNLAEGLGTQIEVHGHWDSPLHWDSDWPAAAGSLVVLPEPADLHLTAPASVIELNLDELEATAASDAWDQPAELEHEPISAPAASFRIDPPHASAAGRPHAKFQPEPERDEPEHEEPATGADAYFGDVAEENHEPPVTHPGQATDDDLNFADLEPAAAAATIAAAASGLHELGSSAEQSADQSAEQRDSKPAVPDDRVDCVPVWEVDRFQWPITVERLTADKEGYFAQAGGRLVAAVHDGLRTLAVTGSRRGEGRTTLALCLARAASKAGIQVAVIDADFARPQLAGKIGLEVSHGWQDAATGLIPLSEAAVRSLADNITILPLEPAAARGQLSLADPRVTATLRAAAATFELVIVDLGPLAGNEAELFPPGEACPLDAAIVVRDLRYASASEAEGVGERLYAAGIEAVGVAENFVVEEEIPVTSV